MSRVRSDLRVVTSNHGNCTTDNTGSDTLKEWFGCSCLIYLRVCYTVKSLNDCLNRISNCSFLFHIRDMNKLRFSVLEVLTCKFYDLFCVLACCLSIKSDEIRVWHLTDWRSCDEFCMEALGKWS